MIGGVLAPPRPATVFREQRQAMSALPTAAHPRTAPGTAPDSIAYTIAKQFENGTDTVLPPSALRSGDIVRLTLFPRLPGALAILASDAAAPAWKTLFPAAGSTLELRAGEAYVVPLDITVKPGERLRVTVGAATTEIKLGR